MTLFDEIETILEQRGVRTALIGAGALAVHGISRSTFDRDLLASDSMVLDRSFWIDLPADAAVDLRRGDAADPLAGVARFQRSADRDVDLVVIEGSWVDALLARAERRMPGAAQGRVVTPADLVLLKLYAGGSQDRWDIEQILALDQDRAIRRAVDDRIGPLPARCKSLWAEFDR